MDGVLEQDDSNTDYTLREDATSCWITVDDISVYIRRVAGGVRVELFPVSKEDGPPVAYCEAINKVLASQSD